MKTVILCLYAKKSTVSAGPDLAGGGPEAQLTWGH